MTMAVGNSMHDVWHLAAIRPFASRVEAVGYPRRKARAAMSVVAASFEPLRPQFSEVVGFP